MAQRHNIADAPLSAAQVRLSDSAAGGVALHVPRAGAGLEQAVLARRRGNVAQAVVVEDIDSMPAIGQGCDGGVIEALLERQMTGIALAREERARRMAGVEFRRVDRLLQVEAEVDVAQDGGTAPPRTLASPSS